MSSTTEENNISGGVLESISEHVLGFFSDVGSGRDNNN